MTSVSAKIHGYPQISI